MSSLKEVCGSGGATGALSGIEAKIKDNTYSVVRGSSLFSRLFQASFLLSTLKLVSLHPHLE